MLWKRPAVAKYGGADQDRKTDWTPARWESNAEDPVWLTLAGMIEARNVRTAKPEFTQG